MIWILAIIAVVLIYYAERMPQIIEKAKNDVPHIINAGKKASKDLKDKAQSLQKNIKTKKENKDAN
jgi:Sec-independent protein translocase protein TatA